MTFSEFTSMLVGVLLSAVIVLVIHSTIEFASLKFDMEKRQKFVLESLVSCDKIFTEDGKKVIIVLPLEEDK